VVSEPGKPQDGIAARPLLSRTFIEAERRRRFAAAAAAIAHERGPRAVTAARICARAHSARNTFYELFASVEDCLRFGVGEAGERILEPLRSAAGEGEWLPEVELALAGVTRPSLSGRWRPSCC